MAHVAHAPAPTVEAPALPVIPLRTLAPWLVFAGVLMLFLLYFVGVEEGATSIFSGTWVHEFLHDGRHLIGFPCH